MSEPMIDIELVVREVLAELGLLKAEGGGRKAEEVASGQWPVANNPPSALRPPPSANPPPPGELVLNDRVVTMAQLAGRLDAARRVVVSREAVVTPAVCDELLRRGIALTRAESSNGSLSRTIRLVMITSGTDFDPAALVAGLTRDGLKIEHSASDCLIRSADLLAAEVAKPDTLGVLLTRHTAAGLCLANRLAGVRAITGVDAPAVAVAAAAVGANVLVADPRMGTFFQLKQMVTEFCRGGVRDCPTVFHAQLA